MFWVLGHLTYTHIKRLIADKDFALEISTFNMLQVCKLSALAFCYKDGDDKTKEESLTPYMVAHKVKKMPNIIELCSYTLYV